MELKTCVNSVVMISYRTIRPRLIRRAPLVSSNNLLIGPLVKTSVFAICINFLYFYVTLKRARE